MRLAVALAGADFQQVHQAKCQFDAEPLLSMWPIGTEQLCKPRDGAEARAQLALLAGRTHELYSAVALLGNGEVRFTTVGVARLTMRRFSSAFLEAYLAAAGADVTQSVGGYQLEGLGSQLMERVEGDHFVILGLPLLPLLAFLRAEGVLCA